MQKRGFAFWPWISEKLAYFPKPNFEISLGFLHRMPTRKKKKLNKKSILKFVPKISLHKKFHFFCGFFDPTNCVSCASTSAKIHF